MKAGERVDTIRRLEARLSRERWSEMDFILGQFGAATFELDWNDDTNQITYARAVLGRAPDRILSDLEEYFFGGTSVGSADQPQLPWEPDSFRLFVSHTHANARMAGEAAKQFKSWGMHAFVAHTTIEPTREWERVIEAALDSCDAMAALISHDFVASKWCDQEVGWCRGRKVPIVPVKLTDQDPHGFIGKLHAARPKCDKWQWVADAVFRALALNPSIAAQMARPVVYRYVQSRSPDGAGLNYELLSRIPEDGWTRELVEAVERAPDENAYVVQATVPGTTRPVQDAAGELLSQVRERLGMDVPVPIVSGGADDDIPF